MPKKLVYYGIADQRFMSEKQYIEGGIEGLARKETGSVNHPFRTPKAVEDLILFMRKTYHYGPDRIALFLGWYHNIKISGNGVRWVFVRYGMNRLPENTRRRSLGRKPKLYRNRSQDIIFKRMSSS